MYKELTKETVNKITSDRQNGVKNEFAFDEKNAIRRNDKTHDASTVLRSAFIRDADKIINSPDFLRYRDKTQVFSLYKNDDISRRSLHVQLVSQIAKTIGKALNLNVELIEAIALGHDLGHTPFGHVGEKMLCDLSLKNTGRFFYHNVHSVRVLDAIIPYNITLQTLDGILCHNGEAELETYVPKKLNGFDEFDKIVENCYTVKDYVNCLMPSTLEGCLVRICDIIAYLGKDRQDYQKLSGDKKEEFSDNGIGVFNAEIINNISVNIVENSYGKPYIKMDETCFNAIKQAKQDNYKLIYLNDETKKFFSEKIEPMMIKMYGQLLDDVKEKNLSSPIFYHHIERIEKSTYKSIKPYILQEPNQIVIDYIASMSDSYFIELYKKLFPDEKVDIVYKGYFD